MKFQIVSANDKVSYFEAPDVDAVIKHVLRDSFKYSNWSVLNQDVTAIYRPFRDTYVLAATVDIGLRKVLMTYPVGYWPCEHESSEEVSA